MSSVALNPLYDTYVDSNYPDVSFYPARRLVVGIDQDALGSFPWGDGNGSSGMCRAWLMYDLSGIPSGSTINSATLSVPTYWSRNDYVEQFYYIFRATDISWTGAGLTFNNQSLAWDEPNAILVNQGEGNGQITTTVTTLVSDAFSTGKVSFVLVQQGEWEAFDSDFFMDITSKYYVDNYNSSINPCKLTVDYTEPAGPRRFIVSSFT